MAKIETGKFCRNPYNVTGICNRSSCPLANSRYATICDHDSVFYLYMKTIERAHQPTKLWERVKLPRNYEKALEIIDKHLMYWPKFLVHKTKLRLTKMTQMRIRMRKLALKTREKIMTTPRKEKKREAERKRLKRQQFWIRVLKRNCLSVLREEFMLATSDVEDDEEEAEIEYVEGYEELEEEDDMEDFGGLPIAKSHADDDGDVGLDDNNDGETVAVDRKRMRRESSLALRKLEKEPGAKLKKARVLVEVEQEDTDERQKQVY
ncbi:hypothetical protein Q3G72_006220 [Acer saccharum]|nr:hypothetical protein Q3G72_006220 [Acer saccharum]